MKNLSEPSDIQTDVLDLFSRSDFHSDWSDDDFNKRVMPPIRAGQFFVMKDENDVPVAAATWAWLSPEAEMGILARTYEPQPGDWTRDGEQDRLWVIDMIAPDNRCRGQLIGRLTEKLGSDGIHEISFSGLS